MSIKSKGIFVLSLFFLLFLSVSIAQAETSIGCVRPGSTSKMAPNTNACYGDALLKCSSSSTISYAVCSYGCANNACKTPSPTPTRRPEPTPIKKISPTPTRRPEPTPARRPEPTKTPANPTVCCNGQGISGCKCSNGSALTSACGSYFTHCKRPSPTPTRRPEPTPKPTGCIRPGTPSKMSPNTNSCYGNILLKCSSASIFSYSNCSYGCVNNVCRTSPEPTKRPVGQTTTIRK